ncbi:MAG TPA: hypothetical protein P5096_03735 [Patescibacteria group bacterium]|nr:hypothetical protein [Patescibacteria group bacterium]
MNKRAVFIAIIVILAVSMSLPFIGSFNVSQKKATPVDSSAQKQVESDDTQGIEGIVRVMPEGQFSEGTHVLEAGGITIAALANGTGINLDKFIGKNVRISGDPKELGTDGGVLITVSEIEEVK